MAEYTDSILADVKMRLGIDPDVEQFDQDIIVAINTSFMILNQLGAGPESCFSIEGYDAKWSDFSDNISEIPAVKNFVQLKTKMMFDPPSGSASTAYNEMLKELEWRLTTQCDLERINGEMNG